jgi:hypothetical protein
MTEEAKSPTELNPSIVILQTGDKLITFLQEVFEGEGEERKGVCLVMNYPYELDLVSVPTTDDTDRDLQVKFSKWCPYALDASYRISYAGVLTIGTPDPGLAEAYRRKVELAQGAEVPDAADPQPPSGSADSPNWQMQQQLVQQAVADASVPTVTPEVV